MVFALHTPKVYRIDDIVNPSRLLEGLPIIIGSKDILIFSSYGSRPEITGFLREHALPADEAVTRELQRLSLYLDEYAEAFACRLYAEPAVLEQLARLMSTSTESSELCDHVFAYGQKGPLLCFHDAFKSDPLYISSVIPESNVGLFCSRLGRSYVIEDNPFGNGGQP